MGGSAPAPRRALLRAGVARCGGGGRASPGGVPCAVVERLRSGARPLAAARPQGGLLGSAAHLLWARVCGHGGPALSPWPACPAGGCVPRGWCGPGDPAPAPQRALLRAGVARCGGGGSVYPGEGALRRCEGAPGLRSSPSPGCPSVGRAARARRSLAVGAGVWAWLCRLCVGRAAGRGCVWSVWCLCGVCVLVASWQCSVCHGAVVRGPAFLRLSPWCPPLLRYLVVLCLPLLVGVRPSPRASLARLLATLLLPSLLRRPLPFPLLSDGQPSSLACIFPCFTCVLVCGSVFSFAYFLVLWVLLLPSFLAL